MPFREIEGSLEWDRFCSAGAEEVDGGNYIALLSWLRCDGRLVWTSVLGSQRKSVVWFDGNSQPFPCSSTITIRRSIRLGTRTMVSFVFLCDVSELGSTLIVINYKAISGYQPAYVTLGIMRRKYCQLRWFPWTEKTDQRETISAWWDCCHFFH